MYLSGKMVKCVPCFHGEGVGSSPSTTKKNPKQTKNKTKVVIPPKHQTLLD